MANGLTNSINQFNKKKQEETAARQAAASSRSQLINQNAQANENNFATATLTTSSGKQYTLDRNQFDWIRNRYRNDWADTYGYDEADQRAKAAGQMSAKVYSSYNKKSALDNELRNLGLPSEKNLDKYLGQYAQWHTGGIADVFGDSVSPAAWTKMKELYKQDWTYDTTAEDQARKARGLMPSALEAKYDDTEIDDQLKASGLPSMKEASKYFGQYNNYVGIDSLYKNVARDWTNLRLQGIKNDGKEYPNEDGTVAKTGAEWYADAFFDELMRQDENGKDVYGEIKPLFKNRTSTSSEVDPSKDYVTERGKLVTAGNKADALDSDYAKYNAFSYDDFDAHYQDYYDRYIKDAQLTNGQTVEKALSVLARQEDEQAEKEFYTVPGKKDVEDFVFRYNADYPDATPEKMFTDMYEHGLSDKLVNQAKKILQDQPGADKKSIADAYSAAKVSSGELQKQQEAIWDTINADPHDVPVGVNEEKENNAKRVRADTKSLRSYIDNAIKAGADDETVQLATEAIEKAIGRYMDPDEGTISPDDVINILNGISEQPWNNATAMRLALEDYGFGENGELTGPAADLTAGWDARDIRKVVNSIGSVRYNGIELSDETLERLNNSMNSEISDDEAYYSRGANGQLDYERFMHAIDWANEQIQTGAMNEFDAYNILAAEGFQDEMEAYMQDDWHKALFAHERVKEAYEAAGGDQLAWYEGLTDEEKYQHGLDIWSQLPDEEKAKTFQDYDWKYDPAVYRTGGQAWAQQFSAIIPQFATNLVSGAVKLADMVDANLTGREELWDVTKDLMGVENKLASYGAVNDSLGNGAQLASTAADAVQEVARMYLFGTIGGTIGHGTKLGQALAETAGNEAAKQGVKAISKFGLTMMTSSPFIVNAAAGNFAEAKLMGATTGEATAYGLLTGTLEGVLESLNFDELWGKVLGEGAFGQMIMDGGAAFRNMGVVAKARIANMVASGLGEFSEETVSYLAETLWKTHASWGGDTKWDLNDWIQQAGMGFLTGMLGSGLSSGNITKDSILYEYWKSNPETRSALLNTEVGRTIWEQASDTQKAAWRNGDTKVLSIDAFADLVTQMSILDNAPAKALDDYNRTIANINKKAENARAEAAAKFSKNSVERDGASATRAATAYANMTVEDALAAASRYEARVTYENTVNNARAQLQVLQRQFSEHYAALYLQNESNIATRNVNGITANVSRDIQNGATVSPESRADREKSAQPVDVSRLVQYNNNSSTEETNANGRQGTEAGAGSEGAQAGGNAGVSGPAVPVGNQGVQESGVFGRANPRWIESVPITEKARDKGIEPVELRTDNNDPSSFHAAIGEAKTANPFGAFVTQHEVDEYSVMRTYLSADDGVGVAVTNDGNIVSVFKNPEKNQSKKASTSILFTALENGGKKLDNFNSADLSDIYLQHGFVPVARIKFNDDYAPDGWNFERDGRPDILFWVHNGDDADTILEKMGTYEMPDLESLPLFEGVNAYDEAAAYRDTLVNEKSGWPSVAEETVQRAATRRLTDEEVAGVQKAAQDLRFKNEIRFIDDPNEAEGWIDENGNITINRANISDAEAKELADNPGWWVLKHEFAHFTEGTAEYDEYAGILKRIMQRRIGDQGYIDALNDIKDSYAQRREKLDNRGAERELVAKFMQSGELLSNQESIEMFVREQGNLADRIYNWIRYKINDLKLRRQPNSALARDLLKAERLYAQAYRKANRKPGRDNGDNDSQRRTARQTINAAGVTAEGGDGSSIDTIARPDSSVKMKKDLSTGLSWEALVQKYGAKPQGMEPRARDIQVPERVSEQRRESDFIRSMLESDKITDDQVAEIKRKIVEEDWGSYVPTSDQERMEEARDYISRRQPLQAQQEFHDMVMQGKLGVKTNALGIQLMADAAARGDTTSVLDIAADLQVAATEAGQSAQIFSVLKELKGVGSAWYMQKVVDRLNSKYADQISDGEMQAITVSPVLMEQLMQATTVDQIAAAEEAVAKEIGRQLPLTWDDRLSNWRYFSMLANPTTHIRNITGNLLMKGLNTVKDAVATGIERTFVKDQSQRAHAILTTADRSTWGGYAQQSYEEQARNLSGGGKLGFETFVKQNMRSFDTKWLNAMAKFNFNALEGEDVAFIRPAYKNALMEYMKAQGYTLNEKGQAGKVNAKGEFVEMTKGQQTAAVEWASQQAWKATFRDASSLATLLNKISKENAVSRLLVEGVMPFKKTPINIAKRGLEYSPGGIIMGTVQLLNGVKKGKVTTAQAIDNLSSGITGTALMALGVFLAKAGIIRAGGEDKKKYETYLQDTGDQTYALKFGDYSINMSSIAPATIPLFMGVALQEMINQSGESVDLSTITDVLAGTLNPFMEMSFMASLNSALQNYNNGGIGGALGNTILSAAQNYGSQYLPTLGGKVAQFVDPTLRSTKSSATSPIGGNMDYYVRSLAKKVPGLETTLQPDVDVWGRTTQKDSFGEWALDFANKFILPTNIKVTNRDSVDRELIRVVESTGVVDFLPSDGNKYFTVNGKRINMNAKQYAQYSQDRGQAAYAAIKDVMSSAAYRNASDEERANMLTKAKDAAYKQVNNLWKDKLGAFDR